jgi:hypothetical protein
MLTWVLDMQRAAAGGIGPAAATMILAEYGELNMPLALRGLEAKTTDPYRAGWKKRVVPTLGHIPVRMVTYGAVDRLDRRWVRQVNGEEQPGHPRACDGAGVPGRLIERNPARITGWQRQYHQAEDELAGPRSLALPNGAALTRLAEALVQRASGNHSVWGEIVIFAARTGARIGEVSGCRVGDIDTEQWTWTVQPQTTPGPGGLIDKGTKGKRARSWRFANSCSGVSTPPTAPRTRAYSQALAAAGLRRQSCETPPRGTR